MKLQTIVRLPQVDNLITHEQSSLLFVGSCFTENIGHLLQSYKFQTLVNPCGIAYNPVSVATTIALITQNKELNESDFVFQNDKWCSWHHHGRFSASSRDELENNIQKELTAARNSLKQATHIFLTLGTSWVFQHIETAQVVNNCHKVPATKFRRFRLSNRKIFSILAETIKQIRSCNSSCEIVFTVSPVRHIKDGLHENQLSKASLLLAIDELQKNYENVAYFPAYEIAIDELRDYRFFAEDYCHLNNLGVQYIWAQFSKAYIAPHSQEMFPALQKLQKALAHRVIDENTVQYQKFTDKVRAQIEYLERQLPTVSFEEEKQILVPTTSF